jgi:hypothetical protein
MTHKRIEKNDQILANQYQHNITEIADFGIGISKVETQAITPHDRLCRLNKNEKF